jgi:site-specific recombinase XerD
MRAPTIAFPALLQDFFLRRLIEQRGVSARTVESYRDAFELLLGFAEQRTGNRASALSLEDLDAPLVLDFLEHLEHERGNSARTRNVRLAAIRSFMSYASVRDPTSLPIAQRVLAIPPKRYDQPILGYLTREEINALLAAPDRSTWSGRRDAIMLATMYNTGARVSEITTLRVCDVLLDRQLAVHLHGKGRRQRVIPLWPAPQCSQTAPANHSPAQASATDSTEQCPKPRNAVRHCKTAASHPTPSATPARCTSCNQESISP